MPALRIRSTSSLAGFLWTPLILGLSLFSVISYADVELQDCYRGAELIAAKRPPEVSVVVLLDDTTVFDATQRAAIEKQLSRLVRSGWELRILRFSANIQGRYTTPALIGFLAHPLEDSRREHIRKPIAAAFDQCRELQIVRGRKRLRELLEDYFSGATNTIARSEILAAVRDVGAAIVPALKGKRVILLLVSDMLENSSITSFYQSGSVRLIDPQAELAKAEKASLISDLRGASVFVFGAGVTPKSGTGSGYLDQNRLAVLKRFWQGYIEKSGGRLEEFGQPLLLRAVVE